MRNRMHMGRTHLSRNAPREMTPNEQDRLSIMSCFRPFMVGLV